MLQSDMGTNCGGGINEWKISKLFDTSDITDLSLCFNEGEIDATDLDALLVYVSDPFHSDTQIFCIQGETVAGVNGVLFPFCTGLPAWTDNNSQVTISFIAHSSDIAQKILLDSISLRGWASGCSPTTLIAFTEDFSGCRDPIPDGWNGWSVSGTPRCRISDCAWGVNNLTASSDSWSIQRYVDVSSLDGNVTICFDEGDVRVDSIDDPAPQITLLFDPGTGWETAWVQTSNLGPDGTCTSICINLSDINPQVNNNPSLGIKFILNTVGSDGRYNLTNISISGSVYCDSSSFVALSDITDIGGGNYSFSVSQTTSSPSQMSVTVTCRWADFSSPRADKEEILFKY